MVYHLTLNQRDVIPLSYYFLADLSMAALEPCSPLVAQGRVHLDDSGSLVWPVMFLYPEYQVTDLVQEFHEDDM
jgi:hypothetical protein